MVRSSNRQAGGAGIVLRSPERDKIECMVHLDFPTTNNEVEYETLVAGLDLAKAVEAANVVIHCDSQVVTNQVIGDYECKGERMKKYLEQTVLPRRYFFFVQFSPLIDPIDDYE